MNRFYLTFNKCLKSLIFFRGLMHRPGKSQIGELDIRYGGIKHTDGHFNLTTPFQRLPWLKSIFDVSVIIILI